MDPGNIYFYLYKHFNLLLFVYKAFASLVPNTTYEKDGYCVRAKYAQIDSNKLLVLNGQNRLSATGKFDAVTGVLVQDDLTAPGKLKLITTPGSSGASISGDYWVIGLSTINPTTGKYSWSGRFTIYKLTR